MYTVSEDEGMVEVCAVVFFPSGSCPIQFPFHIRLETSNGTKTFSGFIIIHYFDFALVPYPVL